VARRGPLNVEQIVDAAVAVADEGGLGQVSMRNVGRRLGVEAMSLYHHVAGKEALLDALVERVFEEIYRPDPGAPWRVEMIRRAQSARSVLGSHPWAIGLMESRRQPGPAILGHHEAVLACLRSNRFSVTLAAHAFSALDAYVYGFVLTEANLPFKPGESAADFVDHISDLMPVDRYPHMHELIAEQISHKSYNYGNEFGFGLDLILDSIQNHLTLDP
jgi:AcrR family transcriptional regulator